MSTIIKAPALSLVIATPAISFAQSTNDPATRAQVTGDLIQIEHAGYKPNTTHYPADIQAAETRTAAQDTMASNTVAGYGAIGCGSSKMTASLTRR